MERYKEISVADLFHKIMSDDTEDLYVKYVDELRPAKQFSFKLKDFGKQQWFVREVIE